MENLILIKLVFLRTLTNLICILNKHLGSFIVDKKLIRQNLGLLYLNKRFN
jgi:hypothetical protein